jgi:hypothetical protein
MEQHGCASIIEIKGVNHAFVPCSTPGTERAHRFQIIEKLKKDRE